MSPNVPFSPDLAKFFRVSWDSGMGRGGCGMGGHGGSVGKIADCQLEDAQGKNSMRLYTGPKGVRFVPILGKSGDYWVEIFEVRKNLQWGSAGGGKNSPSRG